MFSPLKKSASLSEYDKGNSICGVQITQTQFQLTFIDNGPGMI